MQTHGTRRDELASQAISARRSEQHRDYGNAAARLRRNGTVLVVDGHGITLAGERGRLLVRDGTGRNRRERSFGKVTHGLSRVVVLGGTGTVSLPSLTWLRDQGVPLITLDHDARPLCTSVASIEDARLVRAQALAPHTAAGLEIARYFLRAKLTGQLALVPKLTEREELHASLSDECERLEYATSLDELLDCEREAALCYWMGWSEVAVRFAPGDAERIPEHWLRFGQRHSPLTSAPRLAVNPTNAMLNYLYALLEAEARIACLSVGLSPTLGVVHADLRSRDAFCLDLMEAVRPSVDAYALSLLRSRVFRADDFYETRRGGCRILSPLTHALAETTIEWARLLEPVAEHVTRVLADTPGSRIDHVPTPLTRENHSIAVARRRRRPARATRGVPKPPAACIRCGGELPHRRRALCVPCEVEFRREQRQGRAATPVEIMRVRSGTDPSHGLDAGRRRAASNVARKAAVREWEERHGKLVDLSAFAREILPLIQSVPLSGLQRATGLSLRYVSQIRRGEKTPHPRHWDALSEAALPVESSASRMRPDRANSPE
jgi:CRISPR-associated endonuclease Cas1